MDFLLTVIGVVLVLEGVPWFLSPHGVKRFLLQLAVMPDSWMRGMGLLSMLLGLLVVYIAIG
jgi:hypothetical protein